MFGDNITNYHLKIRAYNSKQISLNQSNATRRISELYIDMPNVILEQSGTPNTIASGLLQVPFSFRAIGFSDSSYINSTGATASEIVITQTMV